MANSSAKSVSRSIVLDTTSAQHNLDLLNDKINKYSDTLKKTNLTDKQRIDAENKLADAIKKRGSIQEQIDKGLGATYTQQLKYVRDLERGLKNLAVGTKEYNDQVQKLDKARGVFQQMQANIKGVEQVQAQASSGFGNLLKNIAGLAAGAFTFSAITNFLTGTTDEAEQAEEATNKLQLALENAGRTDVFQSLLSAADDFAEKFKSLDNDDITGVFTKLVDYGKLTEDQIKDTTQVIIDFAAKQKISLEEATDVITKGFEGSGKALKTYGINLTEAKTFTERYNVVVGQLGEKVKGAQAAFEQTNRGVLETFKQQIRNIQEAVGSFLFSLTGIEKQQFKNAVAAKQEANQAQALVDRYKELSAKTVQTAADKKELQSITTSLTATFGNSVVEINKETGALQLNLEATQDLIKQKLLLANSEAAKQAAILDNAQRQYNEASQQGTIALKTYNEAVAEVGKTADEIIKRQTRSDFIDLKNVSAAEKKVLDLDDAVHKYQLEQRNTNVTIKESTEALKQLGFTAADVDKLLHPKTGGIIGNGGTDVDPDAKRKADDAERRQKELNANRKKAFEEFQKDAADLDDRLSRLTQSAFGYAIDKAVADGKKRKEGFKKEFLESGGLVSKEELEKNLAKVDVETQKNIRKLIADLDKTVKEKPVVIPVELGDVGPTAAEMQAKLAAIGKGLQENFPVGETFKDWVQKNQEEIDFALQGTQQLLSIADTFNQITTNNENRALALELKNNDSKKAAFKKQLDGKIISQKQYDAQVAKLDKEADAKRAALEKQQFERNKKIQIAQALVNGAMGITSVLAARPGPADVLSLATFRAIAIGLTTATTLAEVAYIASQKYAKGGKTFGPSHAQNGLPVINPQTGQKVAELEGNEGILKKSAMLSKAKHSLSGTPSEIASTLNSMYGGVSWDNRAKLFEAGGSVQPFWKSRPYRTIDFPAISKSIQVLKFAEGGRVGGSTSNVEKQNAPAVVPVQDNSKMEALLNVLLQRLEQPIQANVSLSKLDDAKSLRQRIMDDATFG